MIRIAGAVVILTGLSLVGFALSALLTPARAERFIGRFAASAGAHYAEQLLRLAAGGSIVIYSDSMRYPNLFRPFGWLLVATAGALLLLPWRWHHRFGQWAIPLAIRHLGLYALGALLLGAFLLFAAWPP